MINATVRYLGAVQFEAESRGHKVYCDQPVESRGHDEGMTPLEFMLVSLGTCAGYYAAEYLNTNKLPSEGLTVKVTADKVKPPARLDNFRIELVTPGLTDERHLEGVRKAVEKCVIHNTLLHTPTIETVVTAPEFAA
jgi:uncharacterized OsmC-like protein